MMMMMMMMPHGAKQKMETINIITINNEKNAQSNAKLRAGCSKAEPKIFAPPQTPLPAAQDVQNLISWRWSLPLPTNPVW